MLGSVKQRKDNLSNQFKNISTASSSDPERFVSSSHLTLLRTAPTFLKLAGSSSLNSFYLISSHLISFSLSNVA